MKLKVKALGVSLGLTWALCILLLSLTATWLDWGTEMVHSLSQLYIGYELTIPGVLLGMVWGFIDLFIAGIVMATLYNTLAKQKL